MASDFNFGEFMTGLLIGGIASIIFGFVVTGVFHNIVSGKLAMAIYPHL